jgi:hypothetical protein
VTNGRVEVITSVQRRRRWSASEKAVRLKAEHGRKSGFWNLIS